MKTHLLFRDRDLDPRMSLPEHEKDLVKDLELETLFNTMAKGDKFLYKISKHILLTGLDDIETIKYRQDIQKDCFNNPIIVKQIYQLTKDAKEQKKSHWLGILSHYPRGILRGAVQMMEMFSGLLKELKKITDEHAKNFSSEGFTNFFSMIRKELDDEYLSEIDRHIDELRFNGGMLASVKLGKGNEGEGYTLRLPQKNSTSIFKSIFGRISRNFSEYSFVIPSRDENGLRALSDLIDRSVNEAANALAQSATHIESFFNNLQIELAFYLASMNLADTLKSMGSPITIPSVFPEDSRVHEFKGLYDASLALTMKKSIVGNSLNLTDRDMVIITGANQGGKSTFLRSIGVAQLMMESGMFVPAKTFSANLSNGIFTHYRRKEDPTMTSGKLDEELDRMREIVDHLSPRSMVLFNESFSATNEREGSEIARQITQALFEQQVKMFFVTHMYAFANTWYEDAKNEIYFLRAERKPDGERTFKLKKDKPHKSSYGKDIFVEVFPEDSI